MSKGVKSISEDEALEITIKLFQEQIKQLKAQLADADELLVKWNNFIKNENRAAKAFGTTIDEYITKYNKGEK